MKEASETSYIKIHNNFKDKKKNGKRSKILTGFPRYVAECR